MHRESDSIALSMEALRSLGSWAADCAERALSVHERQADSDSRPRAAIEGIRVFAAGGRRTAQLRSLAMGANSAAREVGDPAAARGRSRRVPRRARARARPGRRSTHRRCRGPLGDRAGYPGSVRSLAADARSSRGRQQVGHLVLCAGCGHTRPELFVGGPTSAPGRSASLP
jgi:hypothetical protein